MILLPTSPRDAGPSATALGVGGPVLSPGPERALCGPMELMCVSLPPPHRQETTLLLF